MKAFIFTLIFSTIILSLSISLPAAAKRFIYKHIIIVGVDGAGNFNTKTPTPNMDKIFANGAFCNNCLTSFPTISAQCWASMLIGVRPHIHRLNNDIISQQPYTLTEYPTIFSMVRRAHPNAELGAFCNWWPIYNGIIEQNLGVATEKGTDDELIVKITDYITNKKPELLFIQLDECDHMGHTYSYGSPEHLRQITQTDKYIGIIYDAVKGAGIADDTLFIATADHGGINKSHGGTTDEEKYVFWGAAGKTIARNHKLNIEGRDLAAVCMWALGITPNANWDSYIPEGLFTDNPYPKRRSSAKAAKIIKNAPTPAKLPDGLADTLRCALFLDGSINDSCGKVVPKQIGKIYFVDGVYGQGCMVSRDGYISLPDIKFGTDSFSIALWMKIDGDVKGDPAVFSNKDWASGLNKGFVYCYKGITKFNVGSGSDIRSDFDYSYPDSIADNWVHIILSVDRQANRVDYYANFEQIGSDMLKEELKNVSFDSDLPFNIGSDGTGNPEFTVRGIIDDFLLFDRPLTKEDTARLKQYYNM